MEPRGGWGPAGDAAGQLGGGCKEAGGMHSIGRRSSPKRQALACCAIFPSTGQCRSAFQPKKLVKVSSARGEVELSSPLKIVIARMTMALPDVRGFRGTHSYNRGSEAHRLSNSIGVLTLSASHVEFRMCRVMHFGEIQILQIASDK